MKHLNEIIGILTPKEKAMIRKRLNVHPGNCRRLELFNLLDSGGSISDQDLAKILYHSPPNSAYSHLKARLMSNILEIIFPNHISEMMGPHHRGRNDCWRHLLLGHFFISREAFCLADRELAEAQSIAEKYAMTPEKLLIQDLQLQYFSQLPSIKTRKLQMDEVFINIEFLKNCLVAKRQYQDLVIMDLCYNIVPRTLSHSLQSVMDQVEKRRLKANFPAIRYWYNRILFVFEKMKGQYSRAHEITGELIELTKENPGQFSKSQELEAILSHAKVTLRLGNREHAISLAEEILAAATPGSWVELNTLELVLLDAIYQHDLKKAEEIIARSNQHPKLKTSQFHNSLWNYYQANISFLQGHYSQSLQWLQQSPELLKYKSKWLIGYKTLEIFNFICLEQFDLVEYKLNALKQLLKRQKNYKIVRGKYICKAISVMIRKDFDSQKVLKYLEKNQGSETLFSSQNGWEPFNFEVVTIDQFLKVWKH